VKYSTWEKERSGRHTGTYDSGNFRYEPDHMICPQGKILELLLCTDSGLNRSG